MRVLTKHILFLPLIQVKRGPKKPKSISSQAYRKWLKKLSFVKFGGFLPNFSEGLEISLKSPVSNHGKFKICLN